MQQIAVNTRTLSAPMTGVQRYTTELLARWNGRTDCIAPNSSLHGLAGHAWEQVVLPARLRGRLLFSPANSGPLEPTKHVVAIHDTAVFDCRESFNSSFGAWYRFLLPVLARRARQVITGSEFSKERILAHTKVNDEKVVVIPYGVDSRFCPEAISQVEEVVQSLKLPSSRYVVAVGSIEPRKNLARLFEAWARMQDRRSDDIWLVVVGAGGNLRVFNELHLGAPPAGVFFAGHVEERLMPALYAGAIAMAYPSIYEGFGLPPLEAMASGTPVLAGNCSSLPEVISDAGLLVDPFDVEALAAGIQHLLDNPSLRDDLRHRGLSRAKQFSWDETARRVWEVLQTAAAQT